MSDLSAGASVAATRHIFLIAGEPSGDLLGARLMAALKRRCEGELRFSGVGGPLMAAEGLDSLYPLEDFAVMGLVEVLPHVLRIRKRIAALVARIEAECPEVLVTIDAPAFSLRVSRQLKGKGPCLVHYVAPSVWAWKAWRARRIAGFLDCLLTLLPFEPPLFEVHGLKSVFVGHPAIEGQSAAGSPSAPAIAAAGTGPLLCLLPGSRQGEIRRLLPVFRQAVALLRRDLPDLRCVLPSLPGLAATLRRQTADWPVPLQLLDDEAGKQAAFASATAALAASGTVAVELAVAGLPAVIAYRINPVTAAIAKRLLKLRFVSLPNILLDREVQPERLQWDCTPEALAAALQPLLIDPQARARQQAAYREVVHLLTPSGDVTPSERAAETILALSACR